MNDVEKRFVCDRFEDWSTSSFSHCARFLGKKHKNINFRIKMKNI
jgi:hypothetical protein